MEYLRNSEKWDPILSKIDDLLLKGEVSKALFLAKQLERDGDPLALVTLGNIYEIGGDGIERNADLAIKYYHDYLNILDDEWVRFLLAREYYKRGESSEDYLQAARYFKSLENSHHWGAHYALGLMYATGKGMEVDEKKAAEHYLIAVKHGHLAAEVMYWRLLQQGKRFKHFRKLYRAISQYKKVARETPNDWRLSIAPTPVA